MKLELRAEIRKGQEIDFYEGFISIKENDAKLSALFNFTLEIFDGDSAGEGKPFLRLQEHNQPVFTREELIGTSGILFKMCRLLVSKVFDLLNSGNNQTAVYVCSTPCAKQDEAEIKKFLHRAKTDLLN